jgi:hypothetical protein
VKPSEEELPEDEIEAAEERAARHHHDALDDDDALLAHLQSPHGLDAPGHLSRATLKGLHDRLHHETDAAED